MSRSGGAHLERLKAMRVKSVEISVSEITHFCQLDFMLRSNEYSHFDLTLFQMKTDKFVKPREPIDFAAYKSKLTLTRSGFDYLEVTNDY